MTSSDPNAEHLSGVELTDPNTPLRVRQGGFQFDMGPFEIVWWAEVNKESVYLNITANYSINATVSPDGHCLIICYTQKMIDPSFYIKPSSKQDILACPESRATLQYCEGKEAETFTLSIPFSKKMLPTMEKRVINSPKGQYPSVMVFIMTVAPNLTYGDAESWSHPKEIPNAWQPLPNVLFLFYVPK